jgi:hypothetical protein
MKRVVVNSAWVGCHRKAGECGGKVVAGAGVFVFIRVVILFDSASSLAAR